MSWTITYKGVALDDTNGVTIEKVRETPSVKVKTGDLLGDGSVLERYSRGGRKVSISGIVKGSSTTELDARVDALVEVMSDPAGGDLSLRSGRVLFSYPKVGSLELIKGASNLAMTFSCDFYAEDAFWKNTTVTSASVTLSGSNVGTLTVTNAGTAPVKPLIRITQKSGTSGVRDPLSLAIVNLTMVEQEYIRITNGALGNTSDRIILDSETETAYLENDSHASSKVPARIDGAFFPLLPGTNLLYLDALTTGGNLTVTLYYYTRFNSSGF